jgi:hypothetical protein
MVYKHLIVVTKTAKAALVANAALYRMNMRNHHRRTYVVTKEMVEANQARWYPLSRLCLVDDNNNRIEANPTSVSVINELNMLELLTPFEGQMTQMEGQSGVQDWS